MGGNPNLLSGDGVIWLLISRSIVLDSVHSKYLCCPGGWGGRFWATAWVSICTFLLCTNILRYSLKMR